MRREALEGRIARLIPAGFVPLRDLQNAILTGIETCPPLRTFHEISAAAQAFRKTHDIKSFLEVAAA